MADTSSACYHTNDVSNWWLWSQVMKKKGMMVRTAWQYQWWKFPMQSPGPVTINICSIYLFILQVLLLSISLYYAEVLITWLAFHLSLVNTCCWLNNNTLNIQICPIHGLSSAFLGFLLLGRQLGSEGGTNRQQFRVTNHRLCFW